MENIDHLFDPDAGETEWPRWSTLPSCDPNLASMESTCRTSARMALLHTTNSTPSDTSLHLEEREKCRQSPIMELWSSGRTGWYSYFLRLYHIKSSFRGFHFISLHKTIWTFRVPKYLFFCLYSILFCGYCTTLWINQVLHVLFTWEEWHSLLWRTHFTFSTLLKHLKPCSLIPEFVKTRTSRVLNTHIFVYHFNMSKVSCW